MLGVEIPGRLELCVFARQETFDDIARRPRRLSRHCTEGPRVAD